MITARGEPPRVIKAFIAFMVTPVQLRSMIGVALGIMLPCMPICGRKVSSMRRKFPPLWIAYS